MSPVEDLVALACELKDHLLASPPRMQPAQQAKALGRGQQRGKRKKPAEPAADLSEEVASHSGAQHPLFQLEVLSHCPGAFHPKSRGLSTHIYLPPQMSVQACKQRSMPPQLSQKTGEW